MTNAPTPIREAGITGRYFYAWTPLVIVAAVLILSMPWLGLFALIVFSLVALGALAALASAVVFVATVLSRAISRRWHIHSGASPRTAPAVSPARREDDSSWEGAPSHAAVLTAGRELQALQDTFPERHVP
ncbi:MAG: hypothetical protein M3321_06225 [Actinomycetota bacterium]|nr:hypothetical protein [Actinomycetota bacterium]